MTGIKPSSHGIVVEHKESRVRYAVSDKNFNEKVHRKVRDLRLGESTRTYQPKRAQSSQDASKALDDPNTPAGQDKALDGPSKDVQADKTEGANPGTQEKEGK